MGWLQRRREKTAATLAESASEHLEAGESVERIAYMSTNWNRRRGQQVAVAATDRHVYVFTTHPLKAQVQEVGRKLPLAEAPFEYSKKGGKLTVGDLVLWSYMGRDKEAEELAAFVEERT